jgi:hypothetical protein
MARYNISMSGFAWTIIIVLLLTVLGTLTLILVTIKYYWSARGTPPPSRKKRREIRKEELRLRAKQIEYSKNNPIVTRRSSFWNNDKVYRDEK